VFRFYTEPVALSKREMAAKNRAQPFAWLVHFYTASGAVLAFAATIATIDARFRTAFLLLIVATVVDATDGLLARRAGIPGSTPNFDGARLDDIVDYLTFVFVPMLTLYRAGNLPDGWGILVVAAVLLSSGYGFASLDAKTSDYFFTGFPSYWNIVALYLYAGRTPDVVNAVVLLALVVMVFVRIGWVYPSRTPVLRGLTNVLGAIWAALLLVIVWLLPAAPRSLLIASLFFPVYYTVLSLWLSARRQIARSA
jgi:phosphatidylcholine synthase